MSEICQVGACFGPVPSDATSVVAVSVASASLQFTSNMKRKPPQQPNILSILYNKTLGRAMRGVQTEHWTNYMINKFGNVQIT